MDLSGALATRIACYQTAYPAGNAIDSFQARGKR